MRVIVGHENLDFDALGAMVLARHLHPGAVLVQVGGLEGRIREAVNLYGDHLALIPASQVPLEKVEEVVVVDTQSPGRIGPLAKLIGRVPFFVYDHHPPEDEAILAGGGVIRVVGATTTILAKLLEDRGVVLRAFEAELAYAGLVEDTGGFTYAGTTPEDLEAAAFLMRSGADPARVQSWIRGALDPQAKEVLEELLETAQVVAAGSRRVVIAEAQKEGYVPALAPLAHTVADLFGADAVILLLRLGQQRLVIARSRGEVAVDQLLRRVLGRGGGHPWAAFARVDIPLEAVRERLVAALPAFASDEPKLGEVMTRGVEGLSGNPTVSEALAEMRRRGFGGMPIFERSRVLGMLRRRDLERAELLGMGGAPAKSFMQPAVILPAGAPLSQAERALKEGAGRVLVEEGGRVVGIFTRTDLYQKAIPEAPGLAERLAMALPAGARKAIAAIVEAFPGATVYLVGGAVRDAYLGEVGPDVDLVLEGAHPSEVAASLVERFGGEFEAHPAFGTARVRLGGGAVLDLALPREEAYAHPGALPSVRPSTMERDLRRRDFTVNAMALRLHPPPAQLFDPYGGIEDLKKRVLRPLSPVSFVEDPSRVLRGLRLASRLGFHLAEEALEQIPAALSPEILSRTSKSRLKDELLAALSEPSPLKALEAYRQHGVLTRVFELEVTPGVWQALSRLESGRPESRADPQAYLYLLASAASDPRAWARRWFFPKAIGEAGALLKEPPADPEVIRRFGPALAQAFLARYPKRSEWLRGERRKLRGRDLLALGMTPGPKVGAVLRAIDEARRRGEVRTYEEELTLARRLIKAYGTAKPSS